MIRVSICYPKTDESHFDMAYYLATHMPLCRDRLAAYGLTDISVDKVIANGTPGAAPVYAAIGYLTLESLEGFQTGMKAHAREILGDIPNFTNVEPVVSISKVEM